MLHAASAVLLDRTGSAPKTHDATIGQFSLLVRGSEEAERLSRRFNRAEDLRLVSDYDDDSVVQIAEIVDLRATAEEFVALCQRLLGD